MLLQKIPAHETRSLIIAARKKAYLSQEALGRLLGKNRSWVALRESGKRKIYQHDLEKIAQATNLPLSWFLARITRWK